MIDIKFLIVGGIIIALAILSVGFDIPTILATLIFMDIVIGAFAVIRGFLHGEPGLIAGGALCALMALSSASDIKQAGFIDFFFAIAGGVLGVSSAVMKNTRKILK